MQKAQWMYQPYSFSMVVLSNTFVKTIKTDNFQKKLSSAPLQGPAILKPKGGALPTSWVHTIDFWGQEKKIA